MSKKLFLFINVVAIIAAIIFIFLAYTAPPTYLPFGCEQKDTTDSGECK